MGSSVLYNKFPILSSGLCGSQEKIGGGVDKTLSSWYARLDHNTSAHLQGINNTFPHLLDTFPQRLWITYKTATYIYNTI